MVARADGVKKGESSADWEISATNAAFVIGHGAISRPIQDGRKSLDIQILDLSLILGVI
jgi:hypothetical protein